jgi:hypothetical protein
MIAHRVTQSLPIATQRLRIRLSQTDMNSFGAMKSWDVTNLQPDAARTGVDGPRLRRVLARAETCACAAAKLMLCNTPGMRRRL